jgi:GTPase SAR1 family protein
MTRNFDFFFKNVLIGDSGVGKTSIMNRFIDDKFDPGYLATIAVDFKSKTALFEDKNVKMDMWDTAG